MRMSIEIDDDLLAETMAATSLRTKKATIEKAQRRLVRSHRRQAALADIAGLGGESDLTAVREGRQPASPTVIIGGNSV